MINQIVLILSLTALLAGCAQTGSSKFDSGSRDKSALLAKIDQLQAIVNAHKAERAATEKHLKTFDELDLVAFNKRDMARIKQIHADEVKVYNPDGTITKGMTPHHADELQFLFDTFEFVVTDHIVGFGHDNWTAGISISEGKWVKPIKLPNGKVLQPTGKKLKIKIATIAHWKDGRIIKEYLFWDNAEWNRQIGLGQ
jgi:outer membrane murein-binding lipoprotein Lpp